MKRGIVSHWKVALIPYSSGSMQPELSERAARLLRSQVPRLFSCFRSFHQCMQSTCVENCETVTTSSCISYARKVLQSKLMTVLHIMSDRTRTHTSGCCHDWIPYSKRFLKHYRNCWCPRHTPLFGCGSKDVKGLETFVVTWFFCAPVAFWKNGVQLAHGS